jgi:hypothetical protein
MKKFVLEVELRDEWNCSGCPCNDGYRDTPNGFYCHVMDENGLRDGDRPAWCPLKEASKAQALEQACELLRTCEDNVDLTEEENSHIKDFLKKVDTWF